MEVWNWVKRCCNIQKIPTMPRVESRNQCRCNIQKIPTRKDEDDTYNTCSLLVSKSLSKLFAIKPGLTRTQSNQWRSVFTGMNTSFFWNKFVFFFPVHEATALGLFFQGGHELRCKEVYIGWQLLGFTSTCPILQRMQEFIDINGNRTHEGCAMTELSYQSIQNSTSASLNHWPGHSLSLSLSRLVT